jgi:hypothetical protein
MYVPTFLRWEESTSYVDVWVGVTAENQAGE